MRQKYITPEIFDEKIEIEQFLATTPTVTLKKNSLVRQYDGDPLHDDMEFNKSIAGPGSEYIGTNNELIEVDDNSIFDD